MFFAMASPSNIDSHLTDNLQAASGSTHVEVPAQQQWATIELQRQHEQNQRLFEETRNAQGIVGRGVDFLKNKLGLSSGSNAVEAEMKKEANMLNNLSLQKSLERKPGSPESFRQLTAMKCSGTINGARLKSAGLVADYNDSQKHYVDMSTDVLAYLGTAAGLYAGMRMGVLRPSSAFAFSVAGNAIAKAGLMQIDGPYANLSYDLARGALWGGSARVGAIVSSLTGEKLVASTLGRGFSFETNAIDGWVVLSANSGLGRRFTASGINSGLSWGTFGAIEALGQATINKTLGNGSGDWKTTGAHIAEGAAVWTALGTLAESALFPK
jgi:hypothetical protein